MHINSSRTLGWQDDDEDQKLIAMDIKANAVIRRTATPKAKAKTEPEPPPRPAILGLMTEGRDENPIRDDKILDLVNSREHPTMQNNAEPAARVIEEHVLALKHPPLR